MIQISYEEGQELLKTYRCACGESLTLAWGGSYGIQGYVLCCGGDRTHDKIERIPSMTEEMRQGKAMPLVIANRIQEKAIDNRRLAQAVHLVCLKFPRAELTPGEAALFLLDCIRIGLDPLLGEAVPIPFKGKDGKRLCQTVITEDGYLSMAARGCPALWQGPPNIEPVTDKELKQEICGDRDAHVWRATGRTRTMPEGHTTSTYGWVKPSEIQKDPTKQTPKDTLPGNQARVRAIKRWIRENFPEARAAMIEITQAWIAQAEGVPWMLDLIQSEYGEIAQLTPGQLSTLPEGQQEHWCAGHDTAFFKKGKMKSYAHPIAGSNEWCHEPSTDATEPPKTDAIPPQIPQKTEVKPIAPSKDTTPAATSPASIEIPGGDIALEKFWDIAKVRLGYRTEEQVYKILGVPSIEKWTEPLEIALDQLAQLKGCPDWRKLK